MEETLPVQLYCGLNAFVLRRFQLLNNVMIKEQPAAAIAIPSAALMPYMYATRMPGIWSAVNTSCIAVAPLARTCDGLTPGAVV